MRPDLQQAVAEIHARGYNDVMVRGALRLPSWFASGAELADVAGFRVGCTQRGEIWSSEVDPSPFALAKEATELGSGSETATFRRRRIEDSVGGQLPSRP